MIAIKGINKQNAIRQALAKGRKAKTFEQMQKIKGDYYGLIFPEMKYQPDCCLFCIHEDIGHCDFDGCSNAKFEEVFVKHCFPAFLKTLEAELLKEQNKKKGVF